MGKSSLVGPVLHGLSLTQCHLASSSFRVGTLVLPGETCDSPLPLNDTVSYQLDLGDNLVTLSSNGPGESISGLLYVPELSNDACNEEAKSLIPPNVTRRSDFPKPPCALMAIAPWISPNCTLAFLDAANDDRVVGTVLYIPNNSTSKLPMGNGTIWKLDEDDTWKLNHPFPVYAIPGAYGKQLVNEIALYSGNLSSVPHGNALSSEYGPKARARIFARVDVARGRSLMPNLWIFLLAVLGVLIVIIIISSILMRYIQRRRRLSLQRRIQAGEVDLEMLGIKRMTVPQHILDKMPLYTYSNDGNIMASAPAVTAVSQNIGQVPSPATPDNKKPAVIRSFVSQLFGNSRGSTANAQTKSGKRADARTQALPSNQDVGQLTFSQCTCPICLEDYVPGETTVRELPCRHIFHPGCIDTFLLQNSSLCPVCKISVLPVGYFPETVTNLMVRQERLARRIQEERERQRTNPRTNIPNIPLVNLPQNLRSNTADSAERQEAMRQRAVAMLGNERMAEDEERERAAARPKWLKVVHRLFPILR
ncbi:RING finger domain-containing protein [Trichophyton equinum CBS 127.97]|uniref:RING finger domain-containing protein n=1 Tax=Trichophyton equinum (strain ATCC MYA-4606 / CBS 127.97) TaxID=559882 RepID=F2PY59_TRIEC|nr:RING finger domain-containing protein [Trichophyton equinum CBS 127.97]